ncbi:hypothetical protein L873DRAFT_1822931 [Choiromyces venosus 120613-1]|uniref:Uncharacterized protein n=1 Tax=Choiromyces venosus 120613-1 TaxID=1336337 RepID=A0A3N4IUC6_9PEZI|nr:hypothetical protein L873DRAFT_1822931 [Choiromyces venosus 120613-1]
MLYDPKLPVLLWFINHRYPWLWISSATDFVLFHLSRNTSARLPLPSLLTTYNVFLS